MNTLSLAGSSTRWFLRGIAVGMLLMAAVNALSYFVRSSDWSSLVGKPQSQNESIGFPLTVWEAGNTYGGLFADYPNMGVNILVAAAVGSLIGMVAARYRDYLNQLVDDFDEGESDKGDSATAPAQPIQFSLLGLMIATTIAAVFATVASKLAVRPETLIAIYTLGPITLVALAMLPRRLSWQQRVVIITPAAFSLIAVAIAVGRGLSMEFDKVLMGIFLSWTPQSAIAAIALTSYLLIQQSREVRREE
ncbi:hypothetical protein [Novipirellula sp.]|uniref:hypothetical protein n=1 Tax=Novipirellula sp. TaxID=2795430 RepID=UPI0035683EB9